MTEYESSDLKMIIAAVKLMCEMIMKKFEHETIDELYDVAKTVSEAIKEWEGR